MREIRRIEDVVDDEGWIVVGGHTEWDCDCGAIVERFRGQSDVNCHKCGQWYNSGGQRLRNDWMNNRSNWDDDVSDMDGFEESQSDW
jgi:hypothetical protein